MFDSLYTIISERFTAPVFRGLVRVFRTALSMGLATALLFLSQNVAEIFTEVNVADDEKALLILIVGSAIAGVGKFLREKGVTTPTS